jgi:hypothetical protein
MPRWFSWPAARCTADQERGFKWQCIPELRKHGWTKGLAPPMVCSVTLGRVTYRVDVPARLSKPWRPAGGWGEALWAYGLRTSASHPSVWGPPLWWAEMLLDSTQASDSTMPILEPVALTGAALLALKTPCNSQLHLHRTGLSPPQTACRENMGGKEGTCEPRSERPITCRPYLENNFS